MYIAVIFNERLECYNRP